MSEAVLESERPFGWTQRLICLYGIVWRESLRFLHQRERFISALVRPLVWLFIFAAGFRQTLGVSIMPPVRHLCSLRGLHHAWAHRDDPALQRHAILAVDGLRPRNGQHAHAAGQPGAALVSPDLEADRGRRCFDSASLRLSRRRLFLGDRAADLVGLSDRAAGAGAVRSDARRARHAFVVAHQAARELRGGDELRHFPDVFRLLRPLSAVARAGGKPMAGDRLPRSIPSPIRSN